MAMLPHYNLPGHAHGPTLKAKNWCGMSCSAVLFLAIIGGFAPCSPALDTLSAPARVIGARKNCCAALSPDGNFIAVGNTFGAIKIWNVATGKESNLYDGVGDDVTLLRFTPDGMKLLLSGGKFRDISTGKVTRIYEMGQGPFAFSHDGTKIISGDAGTPGSCRSVVLWNASTGDSIRSFSNDCRHLDLKIVGVDFSANDSKILLGTSFSEKGGYGWSLNLWDAGTGAKISQVASGGSGLMNDGITATAYSPDDRHYAYALYHAPDGWVTIMDAIKDTVRAELRGVKENIYTMAFSPDGTKLLTGSSNGTVGLWNVLTGDSVQSFSINASIATVGFFPDGTKIFACSKFNTTSIWNISGTLVKNLVEPTWSLIQTLSAMANSPDGSRIVTGMIYGGLIEWDVATGNGVLDGFIGKDALSFRVTSLAYSADGSKIIAGHEKGAVMLWDISTKTTKKFHTGNDATVMSVAFLPDGSKFVTGSNDSTVRLWDVNTSAMIRAYKSGDLYTHSLAVSPDGAMMWVGSGYSTIQNARKWNIATGESLVTVRVTDQVNQLKYSKDGLKLLAGNGYFASLWDAANGARIRTIDSGARYIESIDFSHDGTKILIGEQNGSGGLWDAGTGKCLRRFMGYSMSDAMFSSNDSFVISRNLGYVFLWDIVSRNASILFTRPMNTFSGITLLSARRNGLVFSMPPAYGSGTNPVLELYQANGRRLKIIPLSPIPESRRLTIWLPQALISGRYFYSIHGLGCNEISGAFAAIR